MRTLMFALVMVASCGGNDDQEISEATPCERLREHLIDLRLAEAMHVDKDAHREAFRTAMGADFLASCSKLDEDAVTCAISAADLLSCAPLS